VIISSKVQGFGVTFPYKPDSAGKRTVKEMIFNRKTSPESKRTPDQYCGNQFKGYLFQDYLYDESR